MSFLAERAELSLRLVTFSAFRDAQGKTMLARTIHEGGEDAAAVGRRPSVPAPAAEAVLALADQNGTGGVLRTLYRAAMDVGLHARPWAKSIMFAPPTAKNRCLFVVWVDRRQREPGVAKAYMGAEPFEQFFGIKEPAVVEALGIGPLHSGYTMLDQSKADRIAAGLRKLLATPGGV